jgi:sortase (surface protein transpeptidase)
VITVVRRQGGRLWLIALLVSCLVVVIAGGRLALASDSADVPRAPLPDRTVSAPDAESPSPSPRREQRSGPLRTASQPRVKTSEPGRPKTLAIPRLDLKMSITAVTVDDTGAMAVPSRPTEIGWYAYGPRPGSARGSAVLGGHVDSREYGVGPLVALQQLRRGDEILVTTTTSTERFRVSGVQLISKRDLDVRDMFKRDGEPLLRILTCGGTFRRSGGYQANVVVTARPV